MKITRRRIFEIMEKAKKGDIPSKIFDWTLMILITLNVLAVVLQSFQQLQTNYAVQFKMFETVSVLIFTIEYVLRIWTSDLKFPRKTRARSVIAFVFSGMAIIDFLAILPFYLPMVLPVDLRILRILRLTRIFRIMKLGRYSSSLALIGRVLKRTKTNLIVTLFVTFLLILLASSLMYYVENPVQPDKFPNIIASAWWTIITLTTVGYGDVYPVTALGKLLGGIIALLGIGIVALPTGIISSGFMEEINAQRSIGKQKKGGVVCPHCGLPMNE